MTKMYRVLLFMLFVLIGGCSSGQDDAAREEAAKDHVWKDQTQAIEKAKGVEQLLQDSADKHRQTMEQSSE